MNLTELTVLVLLIVLYVTDCLKAEGNYIRCFRVPLVNKLRIDSNFIKYHLRHVQHFEQIPLENIKLIPYDEIIGKAKSKLHVKRSFYQRNEGYIGTVVNAFGGRRAKLVTPELRKSADDDDDDDDYDDDDDIFEQQAVVNWLDKIAAQDKSKSSKHKKNNNRVRNGYTTNTTTRSSLLSTKPINPTWPLSSNITSAQPKAQPSANVNPNLPTGKPILSVFNKITKFPPHKTIAHSSSHKLVTTTKGHTQTSTIASNFHSTINNSKIRPTSQIIKAIATSLMNKTKKPSKTRVAYKPKTFSTTSTSNPSSSKLVLFCLL